MAAAGVFWVIDIDQTHVQELESGELWDWTLNQTRKREVDDIYEDFSQSRQARVRPFVRWSGFQWRTYAAWTRGEAPRRVQWSPMDLLDGKAFMKGRA